MYVGFGLPRSYFRGNTPRTRERPGFGRILRIGQTRRSRFPPLEGVRGLGGQCAWDIGRMDTTIIRGDTSAPAKWPSWRPPSMTRNASEPAARRERARESDQAERQTLQEAAGKPPGWTPWSRQGSRLQACGDRSGMPGDGEKKSWEPRSDRRPSKRQRSSWPSWRNRLHPGRLRQVAEMYGELANKLSAAPSWPVPIPARPCGLPWRPRRCAGRTGGLSSWPRRVTPLERAPLLIAAVAGRSGGSRKPSRRLNESAD